MKDLRHTFYCVERNNTQKPINSDLIETVVFWYQLLLFLIYLKKYIVFKTFTTPLKMAHKPQCGPRPPIILNTTVLGYSYSHKFLEHFICKSQGIDKTILTSLASYICNVGLNHIEIFFIARTIRGSFKLGHSFL